jgi:CRISPR-associated protein Csm1
MEQWFRQWDWKEALTLLEAWSREPSIHEQWKLLQQGSESEFTSYRVAEHEPISIFAFVHGFEASNVPVRTSFSRRDFLQDLKALQSTTNAQAFLRLLHLHASRLQVDVLGENSESLSLADLLCHRVLLLECRARTEDQRSPYLLIRGDLSGIQKFLYTIHPSGAMKTLRARSFYLELVVEDMIAKILQELGLQRTHVVYAGGGGFLLMLPNREETTALVRDLVQALNTRFLREQSGKLFMAVTCVVATEQDVRQSQKLWGELVYQIREAKGRRFLDMWEQPAEHHPLHVRQVSGNECAVCHTDEVPLSEQSFREGQSEWVCEFCHKLRRWGQRLPRAVGLEVWYQSPQSSNHDPYPILEINGWYYRLVTEKGTRSSRADQYWSLTGSLAETEADHILPRLGYAAQDDEGQFLTFEQLAAKSEGGKRLGLLRMDVDRLGAIFTSGLTEDRRNLLHQGVLSRKISEFFKVTVNDLLEGRALERSVPILVVYAGGDDLFLVGSWSELAEFSLELEAVFREHVSHNPNITISGGFLAANPHLPLYRLAELAGAAEDLAKDAGRNRLTMFESQREWWANGEDLACRHAFPRTLEWGTIREAYGKLVQPLHRLELPHSLANFGLTFTEQYKRDRAHLAHLIFYLARFEVSESKREGWKEIKQLLVGQQMFSTWKIAFTWLSMLQLRKEGRDEQA